jgi:hypothetical protein
MFYGSLYSEQIKKISNQKLTFYLQWDEISGHDDAGNEYRMFQICEITRTDQQNWLRTNYINTFSANRVFVEIEFTIR